MPPKTREAVTSVHKMFRPRPARKATAGRLPPSLARSVNFVSSPMLQNAGPNHHVRRPPSMLLVARTFVELSRNEDTRDETMNPTTSLSNLNKISSSPGFSTPGPVRPLKVHTMARMNAATIDPLLSSVPPSHAPVATCGPFPQQRHLASTTIGVGTAHWLAPSLPLSL